MSYWEHNLHTIYQSMDRSIYSRAAYPVCAVKFNTFRLNIFLWLRLQLSNSVTAQDEDTFHCLFSHFSLFVFSINGPKQNATSLLIPGSDTDFCALSCGILHFVLHGSTKNRLFQRFWSAVEEFWPINKKTVIKGTMESKTEGTMWKSIKSWIRNRCQKWRCILFGITYHENKKCYDTKITGPYLPSP